MTRPWRLASNIAAALLAAWASSCTAAAPSASGPKRIPAGRSEGLIDDPVFGGQAFVLEAGPRGAPPLVLIHGVSATAGRDWAPVIETLSRRFHILVLDLPGFGRSAKHPVVYTPAGYVAYVRHVARQRFDGPFALVGHSMGASIALAYAASHPDDVEFLVMISAAGILHHHALAAYRARIGLLAEQDEPTAVPINARQVRSHVAKYERWAVMPVTPEILMRDPIKRRLIIGADPAKNAALGLIATNFARFIADVRVAPLLIWGTNDAIAPPRTARLLQHRIPNSRLVLLPRVGHQPVADAPDDVAGLVVSWLQGKPRLRTPPPPLLAPSDDLPSGRCLDQDGVVLSGRFASIAIEGCKRVTVREAVAGRIVIRDSVVELDRVRIQGDTLGLDVVDSHVVATGGSVAGDEAIRTERSSLDLAGVIVRGRVAIESVERSAALFSISRLETAGARLPVHGPQPLGRGPFPRARETPGKDAARVKNGR